MKLIIITLLLSISTITTLSANGNEKVQKKINFGQKIFRKKLQRSCGYTASYWAQQHTEEEWSDLQESGTFKNELATMCPKSIKVVKDTWMESLYLFAHEYAKDTGKHPRC